MSYESSNDVSGLFDMSVAIKNAIKKFGIDLQVCMPCIVTGKYDEETDTVMVQPIVNMPVDNGGDTEYIEREPFSVHPIHIGSGNTILAYSILPGTIGWAIASDRSTDSARDANSNLNPEENEGPTNPSINEMGRYSHGFFIPDRWSMARKAEGHEVDGTSYSVFPNAGVSSGEIPGALFADLNGCIGFHNLPFGELATKSDSFYDLEPGNLVKLGNASSGIYFNRLGGISIVKIQYKRLSKDNDEDGNNSKNDAVEYIGTRLDIFSSSAGQGNRDTLNDYLSPKGFRIVFKTKPYYDSDEIFETTVLNDTPAGSFAVYNSRKDEDGKTDSDYHQSLEINFAALPKDVKMMPSIVYLPKINWSGNENITTTDEGTRTYNIENLVLEPYYIIKSLAKASSGDVFPKWGPGSDKDEDGTNRDPIVDKVVLDPKCNVCKNFEE